ncbi:ABC-type multidrug transport system, ATPase component [Aciduliprofundum sp. MAR08-339]|uniref:ABC transporter ATP-binding protein n=1 Tax=Aciduliprofundum sp. (strain MAR08-339) TaxID=673860 RepID=UPI0002A49995|nr:ABC-type multidrug transport system, ATPase component [Aciduliprofundum sp. MAR08-339]
MIIVENLVKRYGNKMVIDGLSFRVEDGEIYGLLGPNGSGKSTTLKILAGVLPPTSGKVLVEGIDVSKNNLKIKEISGFVPETPALYESLTPAELFTLIGSIRKIDEDILQRRVASFVEAFDIGKYMNQFIGTLSFGTKQKISIISALLHDPEVIIMDESMNGLDPKSARILRELLLKFKSDGRSIVFSTHVLPLAEVLCDRIGLIYQGNIVAEGTMDELREKAQEENLEDIFLKLTESKEEMLSVINALQEVL